MLQLVDGPCKGTYLVKRAPLFLRAVLNKEGKADVLDQIEDTPEKSEGVYVYQLEGNAGWVHLHGTKVHGFYAMGTYHHLSDVDGESLRDNAAWQAWATARNHEA